MDEDSSQTVHIHPPSILCLVSKLGKSRKLVFIGLSPNTTEPLQINYGRKILDLKNNNIPQTLNVQIIKLILTCYSILHNFGQFQALD